MADLTFFLSNTARFGEMTLGFLSRLAYNSGFLCKFAKVVVLRAQLSHCYMKVCLSNGFRLYHHKLNIKLLYYSSVLYSYTIKNLTVLSISPPFFHTAIPYNWYADDCVNES